MSDKSAVNRLAGMIPARGEAARPVEQPTRAAAAPPPIVASRPSMGVKSLTLRLPEDEYDRLREFAFRNRATHQDVLAAALKEYLDARAKASDVDQ